MFIRKQLHTNPFWHLYMHAIGEGGRSDNADGGDGGDASGKDSGTGNADDDNDDDNLNPFAVSDDNAGDDDGGANNANAGPSEAETQAQVDELLKRFQLVGNDDVTAELAEQLREGDVKGLAALLDKTAKKTMLATMRNMQRVIDSRLEELRESMVSQATNNVSEQAAWRSLTQAASFVKDEAIRPVAEQALRGFMKKHKGDAEKAVASTVKYFSRIMSFSEADAGNGPRGRPRDTNDNQRRNAPEVDWSEFL